MYQKLADLYDRYKASGVRKKLALTVSQDPHSLGAIIKAYEEGLVDPILIGSRSQTEAVAKVHHFDISPFRLIDEEDKEKCVKIAVSLVRHGEADILMKGNVKTPTLLKGVLNKEWGLRSGKLLSHFAYFEVPTYHKLIAVTDVAMNITPNLKEKIAILENSVSYLNKLGISLPKVAVLGAIEMVNESMRATLDAALLSKMNQRDQITNCLVDGPLAFDNAISLESARHKGIKSDVAGDCDLLLMPDIEVGNVLYKSLVFFAQAKVASVILGAAAPIVLTSRSDSEQAKLDSIMLACQA